MTKGHKLKLKLDNGRRSFQIKGRWIILANISDPEWDTKQEATGRANYLRGKGLVARIVKTKGRWTVYSGRWNWSND